MSVQYDTITWQEVQETHGGWTEEDLTRTTQKSLILKDLLEKNLNHLNFELSNNGFLHFSLHGIKYICLFFPMEEFVDKDGKIGFGAIENESLSNVGSIIETPNCKGISRNIVYEDTQLYTAQDVIDFISKKSQKALL